MSEFTNFVRWAKKKNPSDINWDSVKNDFPDYEVSKFRSDLGEEYALTTAKGVRVYESKEAYDALQPKPEPIGVPESFKSDTLQLLNEAIGKTQVVQPSTLAQPIGEIRSDIQDLDIPEVSTDIKGITPQPASTRIDVPFKRQVEPTIGLPTKTSGGADRTLAQKVTPSADWISFKFKKFGVEAIDGIKLLTQLATKPEVEIEGLKIPTHEVVAKLPKGVAEHYGGYLTDPIGKLSDDPINAVLDAYIVKGILKSMVSGARGLAKIKSKTTSAKAKKSIGDIVKKDDGANIFYDLENAEGESIGRLMAVRNDSKIGKTLYPDSKPDGITIADITVDKGFRRQGIATELVEKLQKDYKNIQHSPHLTGAGKVFVESVKKGEAGRAIIPTSEELTQAGQQLAKTNLYTKYIGEPLYEGLKSVGRKLPPRIQNFFTERYGQPAEYVLMSQKELTDAGLRAEGGIAWARDTAKGASPESKLKVLKSVTDKQRRGAELMRGTPYEPVIGKMNADMSRLGAELVDLELLTPESFKFFDNRYLAKIHNKEKIRLGLGSRKFGETGRLRKRGREKIVLAEELAQWEAEGYELFKDLGDGNVKIKEFIPYGDVKDPFTIYARSVADLEHEIGIGRIVKNVSENPKWISDVPKDGFIKISQNQFGKGINEKFSKIGGLRDKYINKGIAEDLTELISTRSEWRQMFDEMTSLWKVGKTAYNPATHIRNIFSNAVLADMGGLSMRRVDIYGNALKQMTSKGKYYTEAKNAGMFGKEFQFEINQMLKATKDVKTAPGFFTKLTKAYKTGKPAQWYQAEEQFFKMAKFIQNRQKGLSITDSVADAQKWLFDYSTVSPFVSLGRRTLFPFLTFQAKAFPRIVETAIKHPLRIAKYFTAAYAYDKYSRAKLGLSEEQYRGLKQNMPEYMRNGGMYVLLPERDQNGNFQFMNMTYFMPWGDMLGGGAKTESPFSALPEPLENLMVPSHPILRLPFELVTNKSIFTDRPIWKAEENRYKKSVQYAAETMLPPLAGYQGRNIYRKVIEGRPNYFGDVESKTSTLLGLAGARPISVNPERVAKFDKIKIRRKIKDLESRRASVKKDKSLSDKKDETGLSERDKKLENIKRQIRELRQQGRDIKHRGGR